LTTLQDLYLLQLGIRLAAGLAEWPAERLQRHSAYLKAAQNPDGGFSGRAGGSDLYYTAFALRSLAVLDQLSPEVCQRAASYLKSSLNQQTTVVDFFSLLYAVLIIQAAGGPDVFRDSPPDWIERVASLFESFRAPDGGYAKAAGHVSGSTYHTFLVSLCYQLLGKELPDQNGVARFIQSRRREDGGFVEIAPMRRGGTNPTAAAVGVLHLLENESGAGSGLAPEQRGGVVSFLTSLANPEGGFRANERAPFADLLSTFTALWTLDRLGALDQVDTGAALDFVNQLELPEGSFRAGIWDNQADVEYTFYGLGCLGLLTGI
jgi:geranylgeranyl transferase type-2 subunit beta